MGGNVMKRRVIAGFFALLLLLCSLSACTGGGALKPQEFDPAAEVYNVLELGIKADGRTDITKELTKAINEKAQVGATLVFPAGKYYINGDVSFSAKVGVKLLEGAVIKLGNEANVKMMSGGFSAPLGKIFEIEGEGRITGFGNVLNVYSEWFGAVKDDGLDDSLAINYALRFCGKVSFLEGSYNIDNPVYIKDTYSSSGYDMLGMGKDKSKIIIGNDIIAIDGYSDGASIGNSAFNANGIGFYEKNNKKSSMAIKINSGWVSTENCHFEGLLGGVWYDRGGFCQFTENTAKDTFIVFEISELSMFSYFLDNEADSCGTLIKAVVSPSGGVSNGIMIKRCKSYNAYKEDIYITENQAVFIESCEFIGGSGGKAAVYFENHIDSGVDNCIISSKPGSARAGVMYANLAFGSITGNKITDCSNAVSIHSRGAVTVTDNEFENNSGSDILLRSCSEIYIARNKFKTAGSAIPVRGEKENSLITVTDNVFAHSSYDIAANLGKGSSFIVSDNVFNG